MFKWLLIALCPFGFLFSQHEDSIRNLREVTITVSRDTLVLKVRPWQHFDEKAIREIKPQDAGELIQRFSGVSMKSYGGLGGMKTFSYKSLNSQHNTLLVDGIPVNNVQTGQVNFGALEAFQIISLSNTTDLMNYTIPASAILSGSSFLINTRGAAFGNHGFQANTSLSFGSFGQKEGAASIRYGAKQSFFSATGSYRTCDGSYPYRYLNGLEELDAVRSNNRYTSFSFGNVLGFNLKKGAKIRLGYTYQDIDQELPGAVVFYNESADEQLATRTLSAYTNAEWTLGSVHFTGFGSYFRQLLHYTDPTYLNKEGRIEESYVNEQLRFGLNSWRHVGKRKKINVFGGVEQQVAWLWTRSDLLGHPERWHNHHLLGGQYKLGKFDLTTILGAQAVQDRSVQKTSSYYRLNPRLTFRYSLLDSLNSIFELAYRNTFRMPSFNELYYNNIGNTELLPERANQLYLEWNGTATQLTNLRTDFRLQGFFTRTSDLILAIPTKNIFVWSMQNIGETRALGFLADLRVKLNLQKVQASIDLNYSFQETQDMTDRESQTYRHQIAYIPMHTGNAGLSVKFSGFSFRIDESLVGKRYSLNENIVSNELPAFAVTDFSLAYTFSVVKKHELNLQLNVKNVFNQSYAYVRSFVMPGRSFLLNLSYAFN